MDLKIVEIFRTIQGEGILQGQPSVFIRLYGCNLSCNWCDTIRQSEYNNFEIMSIEKILNKVSSYNIKFVVITGGEPLYNNYIDNLLDALKDRGYHITIETNATIKRKINCDLISMSPKLSNSNPYNTEDEVYKMYDNLRINLETINYYIQNYNYQIKFVVYNENDFLEAISILKKLIKYDPLKVIMMTLCSTYNELIKIQQKVVDLCLKYNLRYGNRLQLQIWGNDEPKL